MESSTWPCRLSVRTAFPKRVRPWRPDSKKGDGLALKLKFPFEGHGLPSMLLPVNPGDLRGFAQQMG